MTYARKIFPVNGDVSPKASFRIIIFSEGYLSTESTQFYEDSRELVDRLLALTPFNISKRSKNWLSVYSHFTSSDNAGPSTTVPPPLGRTAFESTIDSANELLTVNPLLLQAEINNVELRRFDLSDLPLSETMPLGSVPRHTIATLPVVLLPETTGNGGELEYFPEPNEPYFIATTKNGRWEQVVARSIARIFGLADEFELEGFEYTDVSDFDALVQSIYSPNLAAYDDVSILNPLPQPKSAWYPLISATKKSTPFTVHPHPGLSLTPDRSLPNHPTSHEEIALWEGAGGYRKNLYRSAHDCLNRRRIGDNSLPIRNTQVPFCKVCEAVIENMIQ